MATPASADRWRRYRPLVDRTFFVLALVGVLVTVHLRIQEGRGFDQGCWGFNPDDAASAATFDCEAVTGSAVGRLFGLPNSLLGLLFYLSVAALSAAVAFTAADTTAVLKRVRAGLVVVGFGFSVYLVYAQRFVIGEFCALCLTSALIVTTLCLVLAIDHFRPAGKRRAAVDAPRGAPRGEALRFGALVVLVAVLVGADVAYFRSLPGGGGADEVVTNDPFGAPAGDASVDVAWAEGLFAGECRFDAERSPAPGWAGLVSFTDATLGAPGADVTVVEYFDPNCPACRATHPVLEDVVARYGDRVRFAFKPFVLRPNEPAWLRQVEALYAAAQEGRFFELVEAQFARQHLNTGAGLAAADLRAALAEAGLAPDQTLQRIDAGLYRSHVLRERDRAIAAGLTSVPMILIDGMVVARDTPRTVDCLGRLLDAALARPAS